MAWRSLGYGANCLGGIQSEKLPWYKNTDIKCANIEKIKPPPTNRRAGALEEDGPFPERGKVPLDSFYLDGPFSTEHCEWLWGLGYRFSAETNPGMASEEDFSAEAILFFAEFRLKDVPPL